MFPVIANAGPRSQAAFFSGHWLAYYGIWYARNEVVKVLHRVEVLKTRVT
jgi:hypothetical protein